jgi:hypothetical protein
VEDVRFHGYDHLCLCKLRSGEPSEAVKQCSEAIKIKSQGGGDGEQEPRLHCDRAEAYLEDDMYDEVRRDEWRGLLKKCYLLAGNGVLPPCVVLGGDKDQVAGGR